MQSRECVKVCRTAQAAGKMMGDYMQMWNKWAQQMPPPGGEGNGGAQ